VQTIREHGFDVMLMLEATIGLNEVAGKEGDEAVPAGKAGAAESNEGSAFTSHDLSFLRSLRISVEGEEEGAAENDTESGGGPRTAFRWRSGWIGAIIGL
jgi:hypothetical protein